MFDFCGALVLYYWHGKKEAADMLDGERLKILTESAKYDVSCRTGGAFRF